MKRPPAKRSPPNEGRSVGSFLLYSLAVLLGAGVLAATLSEPGDEKANESFELARGYYGRGDLEDALAEFRRAFAAEPGRIECRRYIGEILVRLKKPYEGIEHLMAYLAENPDDAAALAWCARGYILEGNADVALIYLNQACEAAPKSAALRKETAKLLLSEGRAMEAAARVQQAMAISPEDPELQPLLERSLAAVPALNPNMPAAAPPLTGPAIPDPLAEINRSRPKR